MSPARIVAVFFGVAALAAVGLAVGRAARDPVGTPARALEHFARARAAHDQDGLADCTYVDPTLVPDPAARAERRKLEARQVAGLRSFVEKHATPRALEVEETRVVAVEGDDARGVIVYRVTEGDRTFRWEWTVELALQDGGWRVRGYGLGPEP